MTSPIDINAVFGGRTTLSVAPEESEEERRARLASEARWDRLALVKHSVIFVVALAAIFGVAAICVNCLLFDKAATPTPRGGRRPSCRRSSPGRSVSFSAR